MPPSLKVVEHIDLPLSMCLSQKVNVPGISETIRTTDLKLEGYIVQDVNMCTWIFSSIQF